MNLKDKASDQPDVSLANQLTSSVYEVVDDELVPADELTEEGQFPQYGDFLEVKEYSPVDGTPRGSTYIEVPRGLAKWLVEELMPSSDTNRFRVLSHQKVDGEHEFDCELVNE